ncbi:ssDNA annealing protein [Yersinia phage vB_YenS_P400]|nr:ssDNA annealing protein [Yersinia phage vB_YenS_P400]
MSFWNLSTGEAVKQESNFELSGGNDFTPIPDGTRVLAAVEECKLDEDRQEVGSDLFSLKWRVMDGDYKNRIIFQKIRVFSKDTKKRDKAIQMLSAIDTNAGGKLMSSGNEPTAGSVAMALSNRPMILLLRVWEMDDSNKPGEKISGNHVGGVFSREATKPAKAPSKPAATTEPSVDYDEDIGF